ncbi:GvpL/GvpF family gas vesicle protein [Candidatus Thiosymbion oneisti]|uniref:GvpL/GvpF family gas vesicle protein n=1 Tax=Candidatus Thiosymbion oneisti TaxID=589554 RepID=UPI00105D7022|nr:GvpL/GvpF family gas vesicle protein [Candidatus Thiosymbion oneisti]
MNDPLYLFGLVPADTAIVPAGVGVDGTHPLERLELGDLTAIVSTIPRQEFVGPEAEERLRDLAWVGPRALRHQAVIRDLMDQGPVVPVRFATLFSDAENLRARITRHQAALSAFLERTRDQAEWSVKALHDRKSDLARITERTLAERATELTALAPGRRYFEEQKLRKAVESGLSTTLAEACRWLYERLSETATEACKVRLQAKEQSGLALDMAANWAFLIARSAPDAFKQTVDALSGPGNPGGLQLQMSGPWPPYSFSPRLDES